MTAPLTVSGDDFEADRQWQKSCNEVMAIYRMTTLLSMGCKIKVRFKSNVIKRHDDVISSKYDVIKCQLVHEVE